MREQVDRLRDSDTPLSTIAAAGSVALSENPTVKAFLFGAVVFACGASVAGFAGSSWWVLDLASHFRVQYVVGLPLLGLVLLALRQRGLAVVTGAFALLNVVLIFPYVWGSANVPGQAAGTNRAMMMNVHTSNTNYAAALAVIEENNPDFLLLEEVDERWMAGLKPLDAKYPHSIQRPRQDNFGIAFYSRRPCLQADVLDVGEAGAPSVLARCEFEGQEFYVLGTHPLPPVNAMYSRFRDEQLARVTEVIKTLDRPVLLMGDLNATPWSHAFRRLVRDSGLRDGSLGRGYQPTWPVGLWPLLIPIDHCLHSPAIQIVSRKVGSAIGSDHYPVVIDFSFSGKK